MTPWNPITLTFSDPESEQRYARESVAARVALDGAGYLCFMVLACITLEGDVGVARILKEIPSHLLAPCLWYFWSTRRAQYLARRDVFFCIIPWMGLIYICVKDWMLPPPAPKLRVIISRLSKSPILSTLFCATVFPLKFKQQVLLSLSFVFVLIFWSNSFCKSCLFGDDKDFSPFFQFLGSFKDNLVAIVSMNGIGLLSPKRECLPVVIFIQLVAGVFFPLFFLYNGEVCSRAEFLSRHAAEADKARIANLRRECRGWSVWILFFVMLFLWLVS